MTRIIPGSACVSRVDLGILAEMNLLSAITTSCLEDGEVRVSRDADASRCDACAAL